MLVYAHASLRVKVFFENELVNLSSSKVARIFSASVIVFSFKVGVKLKPVQRINSSEVFRVNCFKMEQSCKFYLIGN